MATNDTSVRVCARLDLAVQAPSDAVELEVQALGLKNLSIQTRASHLKSVEALDRIFARSDLVEDPVPVEDIASYCDVQRLNTAGGWRMSDAVDPSLLVFGSDAVASLRLSQRCSIHFN